MKKKIILLFLLASQVCFGQNLKISQLPVATTPLAGTELIPIVQNGVTKQTTVSSIGISAPCCGLINGNPTETGNLYVGTPAAIGITGTNNVVTGVGSAAALTTGAYNAVLGAGSLVNTTTGSSNVGVGNAVLASNISGSLNVALGSASLGSNITGNDLTAIGAETDVATDGLSNSIALGYGAVITASNQLVIGSAATPVTSLVINTVPYTMPAAQGTSATVLTNNGSGTLSWSASSGITSIGIGNLGDAMGFSPNPLTSNGDINIVWLGAEGDLINGIGNAVPIPGGGFSNFVDTIYRTHGKDSIQFKINGRYYAILDSAGGGAGSGTVTSIIAGTGLTGGTITGSGTIGLSSPVSVTNGGTGQTSAGAAINALLPSQSGNSGDYLTTNGTSASWAIPSASASLTSTYIGYGNGSNILTGDNNFERSSYGVFLQDNPTNQNIFLGNSGNNTTTGTYNIAIGIGNYSYTQPLHSLTTGSGNICIGYSTGSAINTASDNVAIGYQALINATASDNVAIGYQAGGDVQTGDENTIIGADCYDQIDGTEITAIGYHITYCCTGTTSYSNSIALGANAQITGNNQFIIGNSVNQWSINGLLYNMPSTAGTSGQVLTTNGGSPETLSWTTPPGGGTVTSITAGTGLTGGTITTSGTIGLGTVGISNGGTGQTTASNAINALVPSQSGNSGKVLETNGSTVSWQTVSGGGGSGIQTDTLTDSLTATEIAAGDSIIVIPAAPSGYFINMISITENYRFGTTPYTAGANQVDYCANNNQMLFMDNGILNQGGDAFIINVLNNSWQNNPQMVPITDYLTYGIKAVSQQTDNTGDGTLYTHAVWQYIKLTRGY